MRQSVLNRSHQPLWHRPGTTATTLTGRVVNAVDGRPMAGVKVEIPDVLTTWTQEDGSFTMSQETKSI